MAKNNSACIEEAMANLRNFNQDELEQYVRDVFHRADSYDNMEGAQAMARAIEEVGKEKYKTLWEDANQTAKNILAYERHSKSIRTGKQDFRSLIYNRSKTPSRTLGNNISAAQAAELEQLYKSIFDDLSPDEVERFSSGKEDEAICDAYDGKETHDPFIRKIADKLKNYITERNTRLITSGAMRSEDMNADRNMKAVHEAEKVAGGKKSFIRRALDWRKPKDDVGNAKDIWREDIKKQLDMMKTFSKTDAVDENGVLNMKRADEILNRIFDNITTYKSEIFTRSEVANDREAVKNKQHMFFVFKGLKSQYDYNKVYGNGNLFNMLLRDARSTSRKVGMTRFFGDNPYSMFNDLRKVQQEVKPRSVGYYYESDQAFNFLMQGNSQSVHPALSNFFDNIKSLTSMARLPLLTISSISDVAYQASFAQRMGINYYKAYANQLKHLLDSHTTEERVRIAKLLKTHVDSELGYIGRWAQETSADSMMSKISTRFFKTIGLQAFDRGGKIGVMHMMAKHLFNNSKKSMGELEPQLQRWVSRFLTNDEWDLLRKNNQGKLFTTDNVDTLSNEQLRDHYQNTDKLLPLSELRSDLYRKVHAMFTVAAENSVLSPSEFERTWLTGSRGTLPGELMNLIGQFKAYPMAYIDRVLVQGFQESDGATQKLKWATSMLMGTVPLSYLSMLLYNTANGVSNPDFEEMNVWQRENYLLSMIAPSLGIFMSLLDPKNQNSSMLASLISSPSTRFLSNVMATIASLTHGDFEKSLKNAKNAMDYMLPVQTIPFVSPFIRQAMGDSAYLQPGQTVLFGQ